MLKTGLIGACLAALVASSAPAGAAVVFLDSVAQEGGNFRYNYVVEFARDEGVENGSTFSVFDFNGYVAGSVTSSFGNLVTATTEATSNLTSVPGFTDDAGTPNLRFTYNGPTLDLSRQELGTFSALSRYGQIAIDGFSAVSVKTAGLTNGQDVFTQGPVGVPAVPEPATWAMMIFGFGAIGSTLRAKRRNTRVAFA